MARNRSNKRKVTTNDASPEITPIKDARDNEVTRKEPARKKQKRDDYRAAAASASADTELPRKKFYRQRAHANPFSDHQLSYPISPQEMDWSTYYPAFVNAQVTAEPDGQRSQPMSKQVEVADIGCGFGGLLTALAPRMPDTLILGMEIRVSVTEYVTNKIRALRQQQIQLRQKQQIPNTPIDSAATATSKPSSQFSASAPELKADKNVASDATEQPQPAGKADEDTIAEAEAEVDATTPEGSGSSVPSPNELIPGAYQNISALRTNSMKFLPNYFAHHQLHSIYLLFPDPHFKARKQKARIVSSTLCSEYAYVLRPGGMIYTITDVEDLHLWMAGAFDAHASFERVDEQELRKKGDIGVQAVFGETEEGKKVERMGGKKFAAFWRRVEDPPWPGESKVSDKVV